MTEKQWWEPMPNEESPERWLCDNGGDWSEKADALWKEIKRLRRRLDAAERDAARYRYIRDNHEVNGRAMEIVYGMNGEHWDAAIDAALAAKEKP